MFVNRAWHHGRRVCHLPRRRLTPLRPGGLWNTTLCQAQNRFVTLTELRRDLLLGFFHSPSRTPTVSKCLGYGGMALLKFFQSKIKVCCGTQYVSFLVCNNSSGNQDQSFWEAKLDIIDTIDY